MPMPKSVKIAGKDIDEVHSVTVSIDTPMTERGHYLGRTYPATVQLMRRAQNTPKIELFKNATNKDGRLNLIQGEIVLQNSKLEPTYTITMEEAYISEWSFSQPEEDQMLYEVVTLKVGKMKLSDGKGQKEFTVPEFNRFS
jgi:5-hydroxyisourate hydrolase-like protein (transthyretin family)